MRSKHLWIFSEAAIATSHPEELLEQSEKQVQQCTLQPLKQKPREQYF
jgi:hypothetical protein